MKLLWRISPSERKNYNDSLVGRASTACWARWVSQRRRRASRWCTRPWTRRAGCGPEPWRRTSTPPLPGTRWDERAGRSPLSTCYFGCTSLVSTLMSWVILSLLLNKVTVDLYLILLLYITSSRHTMLDIMVNSQWIELPTPKRFCFWSHFSVSLAWYFSY